ncbi:GTP-binding protein [Streptomyces sp. NPDC002680]|uniref:GTP-binding protein n=1 Tax=Streptomyces sp. NPDC002680 TaxID=3364659 RepID=UPI00369E253B
MTDRLNLGIVAHVDAGKTSLTERFLFEAGTTRQLGSVNAGTTQTDSMDQERRRGITIKAAVASFDIGGVTVNLIDTPGHPDFIAEVERSLAVLDGAVLVVSAIEGVQAQTYVLYRALKRLGIPCLIFVNKVDRVGANPDRVLIELERKLHVRPLAMGAVDDAGSRSAKFQPHSLSEPGFVEYLAAGLAEGNEKVLDKLTDASSVDVDQLWGELRRQTVELIACPVYFGSAVTGSGVDEIMAAIVDLLPKASDDDEAPLSAAVFKIDRGRASEKIVYVRVFSGVLTVRSRVDCGAHSERISAIRVFDNGSTVARDIARAGQIAQVWGLNHAKIGDNLGVTTSRLPSGFAPPTMEAAVVPQHAGEKGEVYAALVNLSDADPLISLRQDDDGVTYVSLYGEVQKEVIRDTLALDFGLAIDFADTTTLYIERPSGEGSFAEEAFTPSNPFVATIGVRVSSAAPGSGVTYRIEAEFGLMPPSFHAAAEEAIRDTLRQGPCGWPVTDCVVTLIRAGRPSGSTASDVRHLTPLVVAAALQEAGTVICEPISRFRLEIPVASLPAVLGKLSRLRATPGAPVIDGNLSVVVGDIPAGDVNALQAALPGLTSGEGAVEVEFGFYQPMSPQPARRQHKGINPFNRREYLMSLNRVVG